MHLVTLGQWRSEGDRRYLLGVLPLLSPPVASLDMSVSPLPSQGLLRVWWHLPGYGTNPCHFLILVSHACISPYCIISTTREDDALTISPTLQMKILSLRVVDLSATRKRCKITRPSKATGILLAKGETIVVAWLNAHFY